jgi:hypothetical protein
MPDSRPLGLPLEATFHCGGQSVGRAKARFSATVNGQLTLNLGGSEGLIRRLKSLSAVLRRVIRRKNIERLSIGQKRQKERNRDHERLRVPSIRPLAQDADAASELGDSYAHASHAAGRYARLTSSITRSPNRRDGIRCAQTQPSRRLLSAFFAAWVLVLLASLPSARVYSTPHLGGVSESHQMLMDFRAGSGT